MKLYYSPGACSLAAHIVLEEIGKPYETELVSSSDGSTRSASYLGLNPKGRVPMLNDGDQNITEATAIMMYLASINPSLNLVDNDPLPLARTLEWMNWLATIHAQIIAQQWRVYRFTDDVAAHAGIQAKGKANFIEVCRLIDEKIGQSDWAVGNQYSIADPYLLVFFKWGNRIGVDMKLYKNWTRHALKMEQRQAVQKVLRAEGISLWE